MNERPRASTDRNVSRETSGRRDKPSRAREGSSARHGRGEATREAEVDPRTLAGAIELEGGRIRVDAAGRTSHAKVWAGGDCCPGGLDLTVDAVAQGQSAALSIDAELRAGV